ncbi:sialic acid-binding Ig-like lectin 13 isoform X2 [Pleurodeles waltl]|uniref:sialic acid-binding Ig-like lectin 13 isoform X2 n=1 Tax=Pleurodeles waltl TaxID=8319 RepID=UPI0037099E57
MTPHVALVLQGLPLLLLGSLPGSTGIMFRVYTVEGWSMTTAESILALKGQSAVLPCNFTYPSPDYQEVIKAIWLLRQESSTVKPIFQCYFSNGSSEKTLQNPCTAGTNQYRLVGNPRKNDLSLEIKNVTDKGSYYCRVELKNRTHAHFQTQHATDLLVFEPGGVVFETWTLKTSPGWSMTTAVNITGWRGQSAVLPCSFTYPGPAHRGAIKVIWKNPTTIFECQVQNSTSGVPQWDSCITGDARYRLVGDPRHNELSLEVRSLQFTQMGMYRCRVELVGWSGANWESELSTELFVYAPPRILNLTLEGNNTVVCEAEGHPKPNITWTGPNFSQLPTKPLPGLYTVQSKILVKENRTYTCRAENEYGVDQRSLSLGEEENAAGEQVNLPLVVVIPVLLLLVLLLVLAVLGWKRRDLLCKTSPIRKPSDVTTLTLREVHQSAPKPESEYANIGSLSTEKQNFNTKETTAANQDMCTYADIAFNNKPKQGAHEQVSTGPRQQEDVTYAVVAIQKDTQIRPS